MAKSLEERLADYHTASVEPGSEQSHREIMRALEVVDFGEFERFQRMHEAAPEFWASEMTRLEQGVAEINSARDGEEHRIPRHVTKEAIAIIDNSGWFDIHASQQIYDALEIAPHSITAILFDAIWTQTRRGKPFARSIASWAAMKGMERAWTTKALRALVDDGLVIKEDRGPGKACDLWVDTLVVSARYEAWLRDNGR